MWRYYECQNIFKYKSQLEKYPPPVIADTHKDIRIEIPGRMESGFHLELVYLLTAIRSLRLK